MSHEAMLRVSVHGTVSEIGDLTTGGHQEGDMGHHGYGGDWRDG